MTLKSTVFTNIIYSLNCSYRVYQLWKSPRQPGGKYCISYRLVRVEASLVLYSQRMGRIEPSPSQP